MHSSDCPVGKFSADVQLVGWTRALTGAFETKECLGLAGMNVGGCLAEIFPIYEWITLAKPISEKNIQRR